MPTTVSCQNDVMSTRHVFKTTPRLYDAVSRRCRANATPCQCQVVSIRCCVEAVPFQNGAASTRSRVERCRVNTAPNQYDTVSRRRRCVKTMPCQDDVVSTLYRPKIRFLPIRHRANTVSCQHDVVSTRRRASTAPCQKEAACQHDDF